MHAEIEIAEPPFYMTLLNETGDTSITWSEADDVDVLTYIQRKIDAGYVFFIERPRAVRAFIKNKKIKDVGEIKSRRILVADEDAEKLELSGKITLARIERKGEEEPVKKAESAAEVASSRSYAVRPVRGG